MYRTSVATLPDYDVDTLSRNATGRQAILIVEDCTDVREGIVEFLELNGYAALAAADGDQAVTMLDQHANAIGLILLDLHLPRGTGAAVRVAQRRDPRLADVPLVIVSACERGSPDGAGLDAAAWLEKPFTCTQLLQEVRRFLGDS